MKKGLLLFLGMLMMVSTVEASDGKKGNSAKDYYNARPIKFMERGIQFYIFPNGDVDFNMNTRFRKQYYYRNGRRYAKRIPHRGISIDRDYFGRVHRVGNVFINYNRFGNVTRVGSVAVDYLRGRRLKRVGGLTISYDRFGGVHYYGRVKPRFGIGYGYNDYYFDGSIYDYYDNFFLQF